MPNRRFDDPSHVLRAASATLARRPDRLRVEEAVAFMRTAHDGQSRRDPRVPYFVHPLRVMMVLAHWEADTTLLLAGLFHDVLEDTTVSAKQLRAGWGEDVLELVVWVTTPKDDAAGHYRRLREAPTSARLLKLADRVDNLRSARVELARVPSQRERRFARRYLDRSRRETDPLLVGLDQSVRVDYRRALAALRREEDALGDDATGVRGA